jgi:hypothetical protein
MKVGVMKKILLFTLVFLLTFYFQSVSARSARKPQISKRPAASKITQAKPDPIQVLSNQLVFNSVGSLDENLAEKCDGSNFRGLLWALDDVVGEWDLSKGEFETSSNYSDRLAKMESAINSDRTIIICKSLKDETTFIKYNADDQKFEVDRYALENIDYYSKEIGSYVSTTRMGAKARVWRSIRIDYDLDFGSSYDLGPIFGCDAKMFSPLKFPIESSIAKDIRDTGYVVMLGYMHKPFYSKDEKAGKPTLDDPFDVDQTTLTLKFEPNQIMMVSALGTRYACSK